MPKRGNFTYSGGSETRMMPLTHLTIAGRPRAVFIVGAMCSLACLLAVQPGRATLYQCESPSGGSLYTDSPTQLQRCTPIATSSAGAPPSAPVYVPPPPYIPAAVPSAESSMSHMPVSEASPPMGPEALPSEGSPMPSAPGAPTPSALQAIQPCMPSMNPLNPMGWTNCPPPNAATSNGAGSP